MGKDHLSLVLLRCLTCSRGFPGGSDGKDSSCNVGDPGLIPGWEDPLKEGMATHSSILPGESHGQRGLVGSMGLQRVRHD